MGVTTNASTVLESYGLCEDDLTYLGDAIGFSEAWGIDALPRMEDMPDPAERMRMELARDKAWMAYLNEVLLQYAKTKPYEKNKQEFYLTEIGRVFANGALGYLKQLQQSQ